MKINNRYYLVPNYTMKCRIYPNKQQAYWIDRIIHGTQVAYNISLHEMREQSLYTKEFVTKDGGILHYADLQALAKAEHLNKLRDMHDDIKLVPGGALSGKCGLFRNDMQKALCHKQVKKVTKTGIEKTRRSREASSKPYSIEQANPMYYGKKKQRNSYTYQTSLKSNLYASETNKNVLFIKLVNVGDKQPNGRIKTTGIKMKGWNQKIRFQDAEYDFVEFAKSYDKTITITVSKDNLGNYYVCFKLPNVWIPMKEEDEPKKIGIDVGIKDLIITSEGDKKANPHFKKLNKKRLKQTNRKMSRRWGWSNEKFREVYKNDKEIKPSKGYLNAVKQHAKLEAKVARQRDTYNNQITHDIVQSAGRGGFIGTETLNVRGMFRNKHLSYALSDACMGDILEKLKYKCDWYGREIHAINQWTPSSQRCHCCGYIYKELKLMEREWTCPECGNHHDRDVNAAMNILYYATTENEIIPDIGCTNEEITSDCIINGNDI